MSSASTAINSFSRINSQSSSVFLQVLPVLSPLIFHANFSLPITISGYSASFAQILPVFHLDFQAITLKLHTRNSLTILLHYHVTLTFFFKLYRAVKASGKQIQPAANCCKDTRRLRGVIEEQLLPGLQSSEPSTTLKAIH